MAGKRRAIVGRASAGVLQVWHGARVGDDQPATDQPATEARANDGRSASEAALLAEAATKSDLVWLRPAGQSRAWPAWHVWHAGAVHVVSGEGEQPLPDLTGAVEVVVRSKQTWARLITVPTTARRLDPDDDTWAGAAAALAASRLNSPHPATDLATRWRSTAVITRFDVSGPAVESPEHYDDASGAAAPEPTTATTSGWRPWHLRGRRRRRART